MKPKTKIIILLIFLNILLVTPQSTIQAIDFPSLKLDCYDSALNIDDAGQLVKGTPIRGNTCDMSDFGKLILNVSQIILGISGSLFLLIFMYGGILWILSAGSSERVQKGKKAFSAAIIGFGFVVGAWLIVNFIIIGLTGGKINEIGKILGQDWNKANIPTSSTETNGGGETDGLGCCQWLIISEEELQSNSKCHDFLTRDECIGAVSDTDTNIQWLRDFSCNNNTGLCEPAPQ